MKGTITKIDQIKRSANGNSFIRVYFKLEDKSWAKTDVCPDYRNYARWKALLIIGTNLTGLTLKHKGEVDADSYPQILKNNQDGGWKMMPDGTMKFEYEAYNPEPLPIIEEKIEEKKLIQDKLL